MRDNPELVEAFSGHRHHLHRHHHHHHHTAPGLVPGLIVITFGALLLLRELSILPPDTSIWSFWPLLLVGLGLSQLQWTRGVFGVLLGLLVALLGVALLLANLQVISFGIARLWPVVIVLLGMGMLWHGVRHHGRRGLVSEEISADALHRSVTMAGAEIRVESRQFKGGDLSAVMAGLEVDCRHADIEGEQAVIDIYAVMSGVEIWVPEGWQVQSDIAPVLGAFEDNTRPPADAAEERKRLLLTGTVVLGAVTVKN